MARIPDIERRLENWARWKYGETGGGLGYSTVKYGDGTTTSGHRQAVIPTIDCEADETDRAVMTLDSPLRATIEQVYLHDGTMRQKSERLFISEAAIKARIWAAHRKISEWLDAKARAARAERDRVEALHRAGRREF